MKKIYRETGICVPSILLPNASVAKDTWAVIACDQFTSEPDYWNQVEELVKNKPSTYHIIFPEVYLGIGSKQKRIRSINAHMQQYIDSKTVVPTVQGFLYIERTFANGTHRNGLMVAIDLEQYDFHEGSTTMMRATEKTVLERIPPRVEIRENAPLELPHILVLIDDPNKTVIEPLQQKIKTLPCVYDFDLMLGGGHIRGYAIEEESQIEEILEPLQRLKTEDNFLYAVGDGNHSLATARQCWENKKQTLSPEEQEVHPARYALVELNNLHDPELRFAPIHRFIAKVNKEDLLQSIQGNGKEIEIIQKGVHSTIQLKDIPGELTLGILQQLLDEYRETHPEMVMDYIHGEKSIEKLTQTDNSIGFLLHSIEKDNLFSVINVDGCLPRKTFSMGEAEEKRYYIEARVIQ